MEIRSHWLASTIQWGLSIFLYGMNKCRVTTSRKRKFNSDVRTGESIKIFHVTKLMQQLFKWDFPCCEINNWPNPANPLFKWVDRAYTEIWLPIKKHQESSFLNYRNIFLCLYLFQVFEVFIHKNDICFIWSLLIIYFIYCYSL